MVREDEKDGERMSTTTTRKAQIVPAPPALPAKRRNKSAAALRFKRRTLPERLSTRRKKQLSKRGKKWTRKKQPRPVIEAPSEPPAPTIDVEVVKRTSYEDGFRKGKYEGGEAFLARLIPEDMILPDIPVEHVIALGFEQVGHLLQPLIAPLTVYIEMQQALEQRTPLSVVRLGDGELLALAHDKVLSSNLVRKEGPFLGYAGIDVPDHEYREQLAESVRKATFVGVPTSRMPNFQGLLYPTLRAYGMQTRQMRLTCSIVNYLLAQQGHLLQLMQGRRVLIVGNSGLELAEVLSQRGIAVAGVITPVMGVRDVPRILREVSRHDYDLALIAAGIPAVILSQRIAEQFGKVALDFGHLANKIARGEASL